MDSVHLVLNMAAGLDHRMLTPSPLPLRVPKAGRNHLNEEITPLLPTGIGERYSQRHAALLLIHYSEGWTKSTAPPDGTADCCRWSSSSSFIDSQKTHILRPNNFLIMIKSDIFYHNHFLYSTLYNLTSDKKTFCKAHCLCPTHIFSLTPCWNEAREKIKNKKHNCCTVHCLYRTEIVITMPCWLGNA